MRGKCGRCRRYPRRDPIEEDPCPARPDAPARAASSCPQRSHSDSRQGRPWPSAAPASAASNGFIAVPNGMVGVPESILINAPKAVGQVVTIGLQLGAAAQTLQTTIGSNGFGAVTWTPTGAGAWTINGLGTIANLGSTTATVAPMPTYTVLLAQSALQQGVEQQHPRRRRRTDRHARPDRHRDAADRRERQRAVDRTADRRLRRHHVHRHDPVDADGWRPVRHAGHLQPRPPAASSRRPARSRSRSSSTGVTTVSMRWPTNLYVGTPTVLQAVLGAGIPDGSVAFSMDGKGISGSIPTSGGVASFQWAPPASGVHTISVTYSGGHAELGRDLPVQRQRQPVRAGAGRPVRRQHHGRPARPAGLVDRPADHDDRGLAR